jgi:hypothetical protein
MTKSKAAAILRAEGFNSAAIGLIGGAVIVKGVSASARKDIERVTGSKTVTAADVFGAAKGK